MLAMMVQLQMVMIPLLLLAGGSGMDQPPPVSDHVDRQQQQQQQDEPRSFTIEAAIIALGAEGPATDWEAVEFLRQAPREEVLSAVIDALRNDTVFEEPIARDRAHGILMHHHAAADRTGFEFLLTELERPDGCRVLSLLRLTPKRWHEELVDALKPILRERKCTTDALTKQALAVVAQIGKPAQPLVPDIAGYWNDKDGDSQIRLAALEALLLVEGIDATLKRLDIDTPRRFEPSEELVLVLEALKIVAARTHGTWNAKKPARQQVRKFILAAMEHREAEVRRAAVGAIAFAYSQQELVIGETADELQLNPDLSDAFTKLLNDPDPELKQLAHQALTEWMPREIAKQREKLLSRQESRQEKQ